MKSLNGRPKRRIYLFMVKLKMADHLTLDSTMNKLTSTVERTRAKAATMAERTSQTVISLLSTLMTFVLIVLTALFLYATFYYSYMPQDIYKLPVHLQFEPCNSTTEK